MIRRIFNKRLSSLQLVQQQQSSIDDDEQIVDLSLGQKVDLDCAVLIFHLQNFALISPSIGSAKTVEILQDVYDVISRRIFKYGGSVNSYTGDTAVALIASSNSGIGDADSIIESALDCATEVMLWFYEHSKHRNALPVSLPRLDLSIGIDAGTNTLAHVGSIYHNHLILFGNSVQTAAKCQLVADAREILIGQEAAKRVRPAYAKYYGQGRETGRLATPLGGRYSSLKFDWQLFARNSTWISK